MQTYKTLFYSEVFLLWIYFCLLSAREISPTDELSRFKHKYSIEAKEFLEQTIENFQVLSMKTSAYTSDEFSPYKYFEKFKDLTKKNGTFVSMKTR
jgi:hypothetical protein